MQILPNQISHIMRGANVNSSEEFDYRYVESGGTYNFNSFNNKAMFVLPPKPNINTTITFTDKYGATKWNPVIVHRNGNPIMGEDEHMTCDVPWAFFNLKFIGGKIGWCVTVDNQLIRGEQK